MNVNTTEATKPRRWFRFRLRTLLIVVTLVSVPLVWVGWELDQRRREKAVVAWAEELGGVVYFFSPSIDERSWWEKKKDEWFGERVRFVILNSPPVNDLSPLAELKKLEYLDIINTQVRDLSPLVELKNLKTLYVADTPVSEEQVEQLRLALPNCEVYLFLDDDL